VPGAPVPGAVGVAGVLPVPGPLGPAAPVGALPAPAPVTGAGAVTTPGATTTAGVSPAGAVCSGEVDGWGAPGAGLGIARGATWIGAETSVTPGASGGGKVGLLGPGAVDSPITGPTTRGCAAGREQAARPPVTASAPSVARTVEVMASVLAIPVPAAAGVPVCARVHRRLVRASQGAIACPPAPSTPRR